MNVLLDLSQFVNLLVGALQLFESLWLTFYSTHLINGPEFGMMMAMFRIEG